MLERHEEWLRTNSHPTAAPIVSATQEAMAEKMARLYRKSVSELIAMKNEAKNSFLLWTKYD